MIIAVAPVPMTAARGLAALAAAVVVGSGIGLAAYRRNRRIMRRGARLDADILAAAVEPVGPRFAGGASNVRLRLRFAGLEEHELDFVAHRLRARDAAALTPGATVPVWVLPEDMSEVRIARPGGAGRILPFQAVPED